LPRDPKGDLFRHDSDCTGRTDEFTELTGYATFLAVFVLNQCRSAAIPWGDIEKEKRFLGALGQQAEIRWVEGETAASAIIAAVENFAYNLLIGGTPHREGEIIATRVAKGYRPRKVGAGVCTPCLTGREVRGERLRHEIRSTEHRYNNTLLL
jgi:hypothetical protein